MAAFYQKFLRKNIDLSPLSVMRQEDNDPYFCTPKGASIFGWAGVDGIHFCFVRGYGEAVFAVSPMNGGRDCVHVIARDFRDFLRLLLATGDSAALEQAWQWDEAQFNAFLTENPPTDGQKAVLSQITTAFDLAPAERPWHYLHELPREAAAFAPEAQNDFCVGIIGGADGPVAIVTGSAQGRLHIACSSLHFAAAGHIDWRVGFRETPWEAGTFDLL